MSCLISSRVIPRSVVCCVDSCRALDDTYTIHCPSSDSAHVYVTMTPPMMAWVLALAVMITVTHTHITHAPSMTHIHTAMATVAETMTTMTTTRTNSDKVTTSLNQSRAHASPRWRCHCPPLQYSTLSLSLFIPCRDQRPHRCMTRSAIAYVIGVDGECVCRHSHCHQKWCIATDVVMLSPLSLCVC